MSKNNQRRHTMRSAIIAAIVAALIAGPAGAVAATKINGAAIAKNSIPANRLTTKAVKTFTAQTASTPAPRALAAAVNSTLDFEQTIATPIAGDIVTVNCPAGDIAITGGYNWAHGTGQITSNWRLDNGTGWKVETGSTGSWDSDPARLAVYVACGPAA